MPFSNLEQITPILSEIKKMRPKSILDMGCGLGVYGFLTRIYLDLYNDEKNFLNKLKGSWSWETNIDAVEGFKDYIDFIPKWAYDKIFIGSAMDILTKIPDKRYDLILAIAILEHLTKEDGFAFLKELHRIGRKIILSVPKEWNEQIVAVNEFETHRSHWTDEELLSLGFNRLLPHPLSWIAISEDEGVCFFSKRPEFRNNLSRFLFRLFRLPQGEANSADFVQRMNDDSLKSFYARYETSAYEKWGLSYRFGSEIFAIAVVESRGKKLFVHDIISKESYLGQILLKLENSAVRRGLRSVEIMPGIHHHELETLGYKPLLYSMSHTHFI